MSNEIFKQASTVMKFTNNNPTDSRNHQNGEKYGKHVRVGILKIKDEHLFMTLTLILETPTMDSVNRKKLSLI